MVAEQGCSSKRIESVSLYKPKFSPKGGRRKVNALHFIFLVSYLYVGYWCLSTVGVPYRKFLLKADREGFDVLEGSQKFRAEAVHAFADINNPDRPKEKLSWFDWMNMDIEEHAELKKKEKIQSVLDSLPKHMRVPKKHMPEFTPMLIMGILVTLHALVILMQHWSVKFHVWLNFTPVNIANVEIPEDLMEISRDVSTDSNGANAKGPKKTLGEIIHAAAEAKAIPSNLPTHAAIDAEGKKVLLPLLYLPTLGLTFEYHRRRYTYTESTGIWTKIRCKTDMPTEFFSAWDGFSEPTQITASEIRYGKNEFNVKQTTFKEMYKAQLLSPFTVFQLFCVLLWMLDDYWQYSFFSLCMILLFEGTVVFSRIKCLSALKGMGNTSKNVWAYRMETWMEIDSSELLPGDIMSLTRQAPHMKSEDKKVKGIENEGGDVVPADLLLLKGSAVVTEASLTGESVPQIKDGLSEVGEEQLSMKNNHKTHILYAGTKMLQCKGVSVIEAEEESSDEEGLNEDAIVLGDKLYSSIPKAPDGGALCFVLRTGFLSAQGKLVRMIEGSQEKVKGHEKETGLLLLLLFFFALASSSYVLYHCYGKENRSQYELLLHCILIITSVIPPELPMQMALAVNNSLMTLMKMQVFCTEPYRVPIAGKLDSCLFDKTGTLTTDELVAVGVCKASMIGKKKEKEMLTPMTKINDEAALVLAGCHSLVMIEGEVTGDPLESAALTSMRWGIDKESGHAKPLPPTEKKEGGKQIELSSNKKVTDLVVLARHHFSSKLQRMSCVVRDVKNRQVFAVAKGSPEAIGNLLEQMPAGYSETSKYLAKSGYRVIALGYKLLSSTDQIEAATDKRASCEENIHFAGFIAFTCRVRRDTEMVLARLTEGGMSVAMVTGDALLTAAHVAKEVGICGNGSVDKKDFVNMKGIPFERDEEFRTFLEDKKRALDAKNNVVVKQVIPVPAKSIVILEKTASGMMFWQSYDDDSRVADFIAADVPKLAKSYDLATTGKNLQSAFDFDEGTKQVLAHFKIFARMTPDAKETVIECLHSVGALCLMCGDGANDVGALKQADVGVALLTGFGDVNVDKGEDGKKKKTSGDQKGGNQDLPPNAILSEDRLQALRMVPVGIIKAKIQQLKVDPNKYSGILTEKEDWIKLFQVKLKEKTIADHKKKEMQLKKKSDKSTHFADKTKKLQERTLELEAQGVQWAQWKAMQEFMAEEKKTASKKNAEMAKMRGVEGQAASLTAQFEDLEMDEIPMVKLGDASIAAPFTSKMPSIKSCVDIVRQGRCTLVTSLQMYQILALNCMISSYSLSVLYLDGVKYGDVQMTAMGMLMTVSFTTVSRSKPLDQLSSVKPLTSIFHPANFISLLGQFSVHFIIMMLAVQGAKQHLPPDYEADLDGEFKPGILNSVVFLVSNVQQVTVFVVNLQGRPFMTGLTENRPLLWSLIATFILTFMFASESVPSLNKYFQLVPFPDDSFRDYILKLLAADVFMTFVVDRLLKLIFAPQILFASMKGTTMKDVYKVVKTIVMILFVMWTFLGNDETWEELMEEEGSEGALNEEVMNASEMISDFEPQGAMPALGGMEEF
uniref:Cation-transporting ATPase n=2 Tax=Chaetoceros debilis TaxID=122233 RepID=A0A7S3V8N7_9STRA